MIYYNNYLKKLASKLRNNPTPGEKVLWRTLKDQYALKYRFLRQKPILNYIVDFYCKELRLAIEIDGISHTNTYDYDFNRNIELQKIGITTLRFSEFDAVNNTNRIILTIFNKIEELTHPVTS